jgi:putative transcriptional regulator
MKVADVARETGLHRHTVTALYKETVQRVELEVIKALCKHFDCKVGELFELIQD